MCSSSPEFWSTINESPGSKAAANSADTWETFVPPQGIAVPWSREVSCSFMISRVRSIYEIRVKRPAELLTTVQE